MITVLSKLVWVSRKKALIDLRFCEKHEIHFSYVGAGLFFDHYLSDITYKKKTLWRLLQSLKATDTFYQNCFRYDM